MAVCPETSNPNPVKAIRLKCLDCCCGSYAEVERCTARQCALFPFRFGKNPFRTKRELSEDERKRLVAQLVKGRENVDKKVDNG